MLLRLIEDGKPEIFQRQIYDLQVFIANLIVLSFADSLYSATDKWRRLDSFVYVDRGLSPKPKAKEIPLRQYGELHVL
jgi:hypothetical protein